MKKSIVLFFAAILCAIGVQAKVIYLKPNSNWTQSNAWFAVHLCNGSETASWHKMTLVPGESNVYLVEIDDAKLNVSKNKNIIFVRMNSAKSKLEWDSKWNQTGDLDINKFSANNCCAINSGQWDCGSNVTYSTYTPPTYTVAGAPAALFGSEWTPSATENDMKLVSGTQYQLEKKNVALTVGDVKFKVVVNYAWTYAYPANDYVYKIDAAGNYDITIKFNAQNQEITVDKKYSTYTITLDNQGATTAGATEITATYNSDMPSIAGKLPEKTGYRFDGYYSEKNGGGTQYYKADGTSAKTWTNNSDATLYAKWTKLHVVTISNDGNGTTNPEGEQANIAPDNGILINATPVGEYEFVEWTITNGTGSFKSPVNKAENTFYPTSDATITAIFRSTAVNALLVVAGANISTVTGSKEPVTLGESYDITAIPIDGYSFEKWVADPEANGVFADAASASTTVTVQNASVTVTASATENMSTLTTSINYDEGTPSIAAPTASVSEIGVTTTATVTAAAGTGYTFTGWTLTNCVRTDGGTENATTITVRANGDKAAATVVANYAQNVVYFVNTKGWSTVKVYAWNDGGAANAEWSGVALTDANIVKQIGGCDVYKYVPGANYAKVIFNNGSEQTDDLAWQNGKYYVYNSENTKDVSDWYTEAEVEGVLPDPIQLTYTVEVPAGTHECYIAGDMNGWALTKMDLVDATHFTLTIQWATNAHKYKYACGPDWKYEEVKADGSSVSDREYNATDVVARWNCAPGIHLVGDMNNWNTAANKFQISGTTATVTIALETGVYKFKVNNDGEWLGNNGTMVRGGDGMDTGWSFESDKDACQLTADIAGDYTFTWNLETKKLTVTYPPLPKHQVTATVNPAETGAVTGTGEYEQGSEATLVATPAAGYAFKNWTIGGTEISTEATYTFTVNEPISLVANFILEVTHEVTVSYLCNSNPIPGHDATTLAVGITTPSTITAPAITHYTFDGWILGTGVQAVDATANPIQITTLAEGEYTLVANYTKIELTYTVKVPEGTEKCYIAGEMNSWSFQEMTPTANANEFTITIDGATTDHKYKYACGDSWDYVELKADGSGVADRTYNSNDVVEKWSTLAKCYLMGNGDWENGVEMKYDSEKSQYILLCHHISAPFKFKLGDEWSDQVENYDFPGIKWADGNIELPEGIYNFYFKKDSKKAYIQVSTPALTRTIPVGYYATVCLPNDIIKVVGATLFEVAGKDGDRVIFDEVITPVAGMPYIFLTEENQISFYCGIETAATPDNHNSLHGTFENMTDAELDGMYMVQNNRIVKCAATGCSIPANRAYFNGTELNTLGSAPALMPGRRRIAMGAESENEATGTEDIITPSVQFTKKIVEGQLIIIRDGVKYNAQGQKL